MAEHETDDLGRHLSELIGAVGLYLGDLGSAHEGDEERLRRAMKRALRSEAFRKYMEPVRDITPPSVGQ